MAGGFVLVMSRASQPRVVLLGRLPRYRPAAMLSREVRGLCPLVLQSRTRIHFKLVAALTGALRAVRAMLWLAHAEHCRLSQALGAAGAPNNCGV